MTLLYPHDLPGYPTRQTYRDCSWRGLALTLPILLLVALFISFRRDASAPILVAFPLALALLVLVFLLLRLRHLVSRENWLLKETEAGLLVNLRSPFHRHLPRPHPTALFIPVNEIAAVCRTREVRELPNHRGGTRDVITYLDIYLNHDQVEEVREVLRAERRINQRGNNTHDYRVRLVEPAGVRLVWDWIKPAESSVLRRLGQWLPVAPDQHLRYATWDKLSEAEKDGVLVELWESGEVTRAVQLARYHRNCTVSKAKKYVEELVEVSPSGRPEAAPHETSR